MSRVTTSSDSRHWSRLVARSTPKPPELRLGARLARAELHPAVGHEVEGGDALGHPGRVIEPHRQLDDAVPEPDAPRALAGRGQEHLGGGRVRVLLEEVMLDLPHVVEAELVGQLDLLQRVLQEPVLGALGPRAGQLELVEDPESHEARADEASGLELEHGVHQALHHGAIALGQPAKLQCRAVTRRPRSGSFPCSAPRGEVDERAGRSGPGRPRPGGRAHRRRAGGRRHWDWEASG